MSDHEDYKSEIDSWADMWDEMQNKGIHPQPEKPKQSEFASKILSDEPQDSYYDSLDMSELIQEAEEISQNPVRMDTVGSDNKQPEPAWVKEDLLSEIEKLKERLFKVENEMARMGQGEKISGKPIEDNGQKLMAKIESIRKEIENVSNKIGVENDPSPFIIKKSANNKSN
jgi:hypothetical protein